MTSTVKKITMVFGAGCFGGLVNSLAVWFFGKIGFTQAIGVQIGPQLTAAWLYPRIVWGGIWGLLFLLPLMKKKILSRGFVYSLGPTLVQLFIVFPIKAHKGVMGFELGLMTPLLVVGFNAIWGTATAIWLRLAR